MVTTFFIQKKPPTIITTETPSMMCPAVVVNIGFMYFGVRHVHDRAERRRHDHEHHRRGPSFGRERLHLALQPRTGPHRLADAVEQLGQVATDLGLDLHREHGPPEVGAADAVDRVVERFAHLAAEPDLGDDLAELASDRRRHLAGERFQRLTERTTGAERSGERRERVGQLFDELLAARPDDRLQGERRQDDEDEQAEQHERRRDWRNSSTEIGTTTASTT